MYNSLLLVALPTIPLVSLIEAVVLSWRWSCDWWTTGVSLTNLFLRVGLQIAPPFTLATPLIMWAHAHRVGTVVPDGREAVRALFIGQEFCYYSLHRAALRVRWFWCSHAVHHSLNALKLAAAFRIGITGRPFGNMLFYIPLVWLGFPAQVVFQTLAIALLYKFWIHAAWIPRCGWLEYMLNTPSTQRLHHAARPAYLDASYGGLLIVFDRLFGTYRAKHHDLPCRYGLVHPITGHNLLHIEFHQWKALWRDLAGARRLRTIVDHLFMPPRWKPDGTGNTTETLRARASLPTPTP